MDAARDRDAYVLRLLKVHVPTPIYSIHLTQHLARFRLNCVIGDFFPSFPLIDKLITRHIGVERLVRFFGRVPGLIVVLLLFDDLKNDQLYGQNLKNIDNIDSQA